MSRTIRSERGWVRPRDTLKRLFRVPGLHPDTVDKVLKGYSKVRHLKCIEIGFGSDVQRCRETLGPDVDVNARISPVLMKNGTAEEVGSEVKQLIQEGAPLRNYSIDTVGLTYGTPTKT